MMKVSFITAVGLSFAAIAFSGCGLSDEEKFEQAKDSFTNYTVTVELGDEATAILQVDDGAAKYVFDMGDVTFTSYLKFEVSDYYIYSSRTHEWEAYAGNSMEEVIEDNLDYSVPLTIFRKMYYDDFEVSGSVMTMKESALKVLTQGYLSNYDITSVKLEMQNGKFSKCTAIAVYGERMEVVYTFSNYGSTVVNLP